MNDQPTPDPDEQPDVEHTLALPADLGHPAQVGPGETSSSSAPQDDDHTTAQPGPNQPVREQGVQGQPGQGQPGQGQPGQGPSSYPPQSGTPSFTPPTGGAGAHPGGPGYSGQGPAVPYQGGYGTPPQQAQHVQHQTQQQSLPAYPGYGNGPAAPAGTSRRTKVSRGIWPAVAALSLLIGLIGGAVGGVAVNKWQDDHQPPGRTSDGLASVDTVTTAPLPADNGSIASVAAKLLPSTVQIIADFKGEAGGATGSGFFLDKQGHVVTNNHVVAEAADGGKITVVDHKGTRYPATVVGRSPVYDLAVLYVKGLSGIQPAALGSSSGLHVGDQVVAIGSPLGLSSTVTSGIVSALDRPVTTGESKDSQSYINAVQTDAAINPGNSGGPLVNLAGQVVGVNSAIATTGGASMGQESGNIGVGFAIPIEQVKITADQILKDGEARYPVIGATVSSDGTGDGAHIEGIEPGSPAAEAGLKKDDVVTALDDRTITDSPTLIVAIRSHLPGDTVALSVDRDGQEKTIKITLDSKVG